MYRDFLRSFGFTESAYLCWLNLSSNFYEFSFLSNNKCGTYILDEVASVFLNRKISQRILVSYKTTLISKVALANHCSHKNTLATSLQVLWWFGWTDLTSITVYRIQYTEILSVTESTWCRLHRSVYFEKTKLCWNWVFFIDHTWQFHFFRFVCTPTTTSTATARLFIFLFF